MGGKGADRAVLACPVFGDVDFVAAIDTNLAIGCISPQGHCPGRYSIRSIMLLT